MKSSLYIIESILNEAPLLDLAGHPQSIITNPNPSSVPKINLIENGPKTIPPTTKSLKIPRITCESEDPEPQHINATENSTKATTPTTRPLKRPREEPERQQMTYKSFKSDYTRDLEAQVKALQDYIVSKDLMTEAPKSMKKYPKARIVRPDNAKDLDKLICKSITEHCQEVIQIEVSLWPHSGIPPDDYSEAMERFVPDIEHLSKMPGGLGMAFDALDMLCNLSLGLAPGTLEYNIPMEKGKRPLHPLLDDLACEYVESMRMSGWGTAIKDHADLLASSEKGREEKGY